MPNEVNMTWPLDDKTTLRLTLVTEGPFSATDLEAIAKITDAVAEVGREPEDIKPDHHEEHHETIESLRRELDAERNRVLSIKEDMAHHREHHETIAAHHEDFARIYGILNDYDCGPYREALDAIRQIVRPAPSSPVGDAEAVPPASAVTDGDQSPDGVDLSTASPPSPSGSAAGGTGECSTCGHRLSSHWARRCEVPACGCAAISLYAICTICGSRLGPSGDGVYWCPQHGKPMPAAIEWLVAP